MAGSTRQASPDIGEVATAFPASKLPQVTYADLPDSLPLRKVLGPGVVAAGIGLGSGEFVLWPYIAANAGLVFLWAAVVGATIQFFLNMEIERYTLATGETAVTGFSRFWRGWGLFFALGAVGANAWPGWITGSATLVTYLIGTENEVPIALAGLLAIALTLTISPVVYQALERVEFVKVGLVSVFVLVALALVVPAQSWADLPQAVTAPRVPTELGFSFLLGALAFAGSGGAQNLVQSNWIRDKGYGMGARIPKLVSPITGEEEARPSTGYLLRPDEPNLRRWNEWWRVANTEQAVTFLALTILTITFTSLIAYSTVFGRELEQDVSFLQVEGQALGELVGGWFRTLFWAIGAFSLFGTALGVVDYTSRLTADVVKTSYLQERGWSESRIYASVVWFIAVAGAVILLTIESQPLILLVISACTGGFLMFIYSALLIQLNRTVLPEPIKVRGLRLGALIVSFLFFGVFSLLTFAEELPALFGG